MIKINLLPQEMAGGRAGGGASSSGSGSGGAFVALILALIFIVNVAIVGVLFVQYTGAKQRYDTVKAKADKVHAEMTTKQNEYTATQMSYDRMSKIVALDRALDPPDRVLWSRKLNMLPMLVPEGVSTTQLQVVQKASERETQESIKRRNEYEKKKKGKNPGPAPVPEKVPVYAQTMMISGIAYVPGGTENQRLESIVQFNRNLMSSKKKLPFDKAETSFMEGFQTSVRPSAVRSEKRDGRDVQTFTFTINARPVTVETKEEGASSEAGATSAAPTKTTAAAK